MCVHIIQRYDDNIKEKGGGGRERKEKDKYTKNLQGWPPPVCGCCFCEPTRAAFYMYVHMYPHTHMRIPIYMHIAHTHIHAHNLCPYIYILKCTHTLMHTPIHIHECASARGCAARACTQHIRVRVHRHACTLTRVSPITHTYTQRIRARVHRHACTLTRVNLTTHAHTHPCARA